MDANLQNEFSYLFQEINRAKMQLSAIKFQGDQPSAIPGQHVGKVIPSIEGGTAVYLSGATQPRYQVNIVVSPDGPYCAKSFHINFKENDYGYWASIDDLPVGFYWEYKVSGSNRDRQNVPVPSSLINRSEIGGNGFYELIPHDTFEVNTTVTVWLTFWATNMVLPYDITIWAGFNGFYVLG
jgi:hypothetical protein